MSAPQRRHRVASALMAQELLATRPGLDRSGFAQAARDAGVPVETISIRGRSFADYFERSGADDLYADYAKQFGSHLRRKALEHYVSFEILDLERHHHYLDVASSGSVVPEVLRRHLGLEEVWRQDLNYPAGVAGHRIGSNAARIPMPDRSFDRMALHCSFEHFEGRADTGFVEEAARLLRPDGRICIVPLYVADRAHILSNRELLEERGLPAFDPGTPIYLHDERANHFGRFYDIESWTERVVRPAWAAGLIVTLMDVRFDTEGLGIGTGFALRLDKPALPCEELGPALRRSVIAPAGDRYSVAADGRVGIPIRVENRSTHPWYTEREIGGVSASVRLGVRWYEGHACEPPALLHTSQRVSFDEPVAPGDEVTLTLDVSPRDLGLANPGSYTAEIAMVHEGVCWFDRDGDAAARVQVLVSER